MVNVQVKEFKIKLGGKPYTFRLDFKALLRFMDRYEDGIIIFNDLLSGKNQHKCVVKILSCACIEKEWKEEVLAEHLAFNFNTMKFIDEITFALVEGLIEENEDNINEGEQGKNE